MTRAQLDRAVARRTRETPRTIRRLGFRLQSGPRDDLEPEHLRLVVACPHCGRPVPYPGTDAYGSPALAECPDPRCDIYFDLDPSCVHAAIA